MTKPERSELLLHKTSVQICGCPECPLDPLKFTIYPKEEEEKNLQAKALAFSRLHQLKRVSGFGKPYSVCMGIQYISSDWWLMILKSLLSDFFLSLSNKKPQALISSLIKSYIQVLMKIVKTLMKKFKVYAYPKVCLLLTIAILMNHIWIGVRCTWIEEVRPSWQITLKVLWFPCEHRISSLKSTNVLINTQQIP